MHVLCSKGLNRLFTHCVLPLRESDQGWYTGGEIIYVSALPVACCMCLCVVATYRDCIFSILDHMTKKEGLRMKGLVTS